MSFSLESARLIVREFINEDEGLYIALHLDPIVSVFLPPRTPEQYCELFHQSVNQAGALLNRWAIIERESGDFMGSCLLREFNAGDDSIIELGYSLAASYWSRGFATEMAKLMVAYAFTLPQTKKVVAVTDLENIGSQTVLLKSGFKQFGTIERYEGLVLAYFEVNIDR